MMTSKPYKYGIEYLHADGFWRDFKLYPKQKDAVQAFNQIRANLLSSTQHRPLYSH